jgi:AcrR family transcriptional regulator
LTRDEILKASAHIFSQQGFHAASMQDIAEAVSLQKASLYHHFPSKQDILVALLDRALDIIIERLEEVVSKPLNPEDKLRQAMTTYLISLAENQDLASVLLLEHRSLEPEFRSHHIPRRDRFEHIWRDLVSEGKDAGVFKCAQPSLAGRALLGVMNWTVTWYRRDGAMPITEIADQFTDMFLHGLLVHEPFDVNESK